MFLIKTCHLDPEEVDLCASLGLRTEPVCPDNPACTKKANDPGEVCHNSRQQCAMVYCSNWFTGVWVESVGMLYIYLRVIPNNTRLNASEQQDLQPISFLAENQLMSGSRLRMVQTEM